MIGVIADFHYASLREPIGPAVFAYRQWFFDYLALRVRDFSAVRPFLEATWDTFMPADKPFAFTFLMKNSMRFIGRKGFGTGYYRFWPGWCVCWRVWVCSVWRLLRLNAAGARLAFARCSARLFQVLFCCCPKRF